MKIAFFAATPNDRELIEKYLQRYSLEADIFAEDIVELNGKIDLSPYEAVSIASLGTIDNSIWDQMPSLKLVALRTIGFQYVDIDYCRSRGINVTNAYYDPYNVADFTIMLMLMTLRKVKVSICRAIVNDFALEGLMGKQIHSLTVGVLGTGKIGRNVIKDLSGFGCKIYCYDLYENESVKEYAEYKDLDFIYRNCDVITLHMPLTKDNYHIIDKNAMDKMKNGVILINTARGPLIDTDALIRGIETSHIGGAGLDTVEGEEGLAHVNFGADVEGLASKMKIMYLKQFANVIYTPHYAYLTQEAKDSMVHSSFEAMLSLRDGKPFSHQVN